MSEDKVLLKLPSAQKMEQIREILEDDEDWRFGRPKIDGKKPRFELPAPTKQDPDEVEIAKSFYGVVLLARKNFYQSEEDKEKGNEPKEKRALYILRAGKYMPELLYVSPTALRNWKFFAKECRDRGIDYFSVMCEFAAEQVTGKANGYTWSKPTFKISRTLTEDELAHVMDIRELVLGRVKEYEDNSELDKAEDEALSVDRVRKDDEDDQETHSKKSRGHVEDDDDTPPAPVKKKKKPADDEDEEEEKPKKKRKPVEDDEDEEEEKPKKKKKPVEDDEDEEEEKPKKKKKPVEDDEDEEEEKPKKSKGRAGYPDLDDDEDEELTKPKKKSKSVEDDD
jgi:hypothetical protein